MKDLAMELISVSRAILSVWSGPTTYPLLTTICSSVAEAREQMFELTVYSTLSKIRLLREVSKGNSPKSTMHLSKTAERSFHRSSSTFMIVSSLIKASYNHPCLRLRI